MCGPLLPMLVAHRSDRQSHLRASTNIVGSTRKALFNILYMLHSSMGIADIEIRMAIQVAINAIVRRIVPVRISIKSAAFLRASLLGAGVLVLRKQSLLLVVNSCNKHSKAHNKQTILVLDRYGLARSWIGAIEDEEALLEVDLVVAHLPAPIHDDVGDGKKIDRALGVVHRLTEINRHCTSRVDRVEAKRRRTNARSRRSVAISIDHLHR